MSHLKKNLSPNPLPPKKNKGGGLLREIATLRLFALAERLAEAGAEWLHKKIRMELWGYAPLETAMGQDLIYEKYDGIRPAPGYPAQPEHSEKVKLFELLNATQHTGITLT